MVRVRLLPQRVELLVPAGTRLLDALDDVQGAGLPTACRAANCGLCLVRVLEGERALEPPASAESVLCKALGGAGGAGLRLGCQLTLAADAASGQHVVLEIVVAARS
jgi:ferredoxin